MAIHDSNGIISETGKTDSVSQSSFFKTLELKVLLKTADIKFKMKAIFLFFFFSNTCSLQQYILTLTSPFNLSETKPFNLK